MKQRANGTNMDGWVDIVREVSIYNKVATHKQSMSWFLAALWYTKADQWIRLWSG